MKLNKLHARLAVCVCVCVLVRGQVRWVGNLLLSKSTASKVVLWKPDMFALHGLDHGSGGGGATHHLPPSSSPSPFSSSAEPSFGNVTPDLDASSKSSSSGGGGEGNADGDANSSSALAPPASDGVATPAAALVLREFEFHDADIWCSLRVFVVFSLLLLSLRVLSFFIYFCLPLPLETPVIFLET